MTSKSDDQLVTDHLQQPSNQEVELATVFTDSEGPQFSDAIWCGQLDIADPAFYPADKYRLSHSEGFHTARLLIKKGPQLGGFIELPIVDGALNGQQIRHEVASFDWSDTPKEDNNHTADTHYPELTVIICTRDRGEMLSSALESVLANNYPHFTVLIVDNAPSTTATKDYLARLNNPKVSLITEPFPGLSPARNAGIKAATTELVAFTDDDVVVDSNWVSNLVLGFNNNPHIACVCGIVPSAEIITPSQAYFDARIGWARNVKPKLYSLQHPPADLPLFPFQVGAYGTGANFAIRRSVVFELGGFDDALGAGSPTKGGEDLDMFFRLIVAGKTISYQPNAVVWHRHRADNDALTEQSYGYGLGLGAWIATLFTDPKNLKLAVTTGLRQLPHFFTLALRMWHSAAPSEKLSDALPPGIRKVEISAIFAGPKAYIQSRRLGRQRYPLRNYLKESR